MNLIKSALRTKGSLHNCLVIVSSMPTYLTVTALIDTLHVYRLQQECNNKYDSGC